MRQRFQDRTVLITGGSSGIGAEAARQFAAEGARVAIVARSADALKKVVEETGGEERALAITADITDLGRLEDILDIVARRFGAIHVVVNNAGYTSRGALEHRSVEALARIVDVNLKAPIVLSRLALPHLRQAGGGAIVNVASLAGRIPVAEEATYSATKFGLRAFSFALAEELAGSGITASLVSPGPVETGFIFSDFKEVPDIVFSQPMSSARQVASRILDCAHDGKLERVIPPLSGPLTTFGYLFPGISRRAKPFFARRGRALRKRYEKSNE